MDEETNQTETTAIAEVIAAVVSYNNPQNLMSPEDFATRILEIIQNGIKKIQSTSYSSQHPSCSSQHPSCSSQHPSCSSQHPSCSSQHPSCSSQHPSCSSQHPSCSSQHPSCNCQHPSCSKQHPSCSCTNVATCSECMILSALSALETVFEFLKERNLYNTNSSDSAPQVDNQSKDNMETTLAGSLPLKQCHSKTDMENWYFDAARLSSSRTGTDSLVKCLISSCKFKSFLSRKVLISGMNTHLIEVSQVLTTLKRECPAVAQLCVPVLEILRDMMSRNKCKNRNINSMTFKFFKEMGFHGFMEARFSENKKSFVDTSGFLEYLSLLCKVIKYVICSHEKLNIEDVNYIVALVDKICLQFGDYFFAITRADKGHLICLEYIKVINFLLDIRFLENKSTFQEKIFQISKSLRLRIHKYLVMAENSGLIWHVNFIGAKLNLQTTNNINSVSSLKRQIILLVLKTMAFALKGESSCSVSIDHDLESFWSEISSSVSKSKRHYSKDWLLVVFADQDDQWITVLLCLLIIHKELKKWHSEQQKLRQMSRKTVGSQELSSQTLQQTICPHRLFLQLVRFIDYDHLVLTDFLTSPETPFLFYFTQYVHVILEDWPGFLSACVDNIQVDNVNHNDVHGLENIVSDKCSQIDMTSCESIKHDLSFLESSTTRAVQLGDVSQHSIRVSQVLPESNSLLPYQLFGEVITSSHDPLQSSKCVSISPIHSSEPQSNPLPSSLTEDNYTSQLPTKSCVQLQSSEAASGGPVTCTTSGFMLYSLTPTSVPYNSSASCNAVLKEHSVNEYFSNQGCSVSQSHTDDVVMGMYDRTASRSSTSLVAYSDSDSETSMTETGVSCVVGKEIVEEHVWNIDNSCEVGNRVEADRSCLSEQDSESEDSFLSEHGSATDSMVDHVDQYVNCNDELDAVMGMMIRLRLHVERLDHSKLFPYNVTSLLQILESCEELYEMPCGS